MKNIELKLMNAASLDFNDESFDFVIMSLLLHKISEKEQGSCFERGFTRS